MNRARSQSTAHACQGALVVAAFFALFAVPILYSALVTQNLNIGERICFVAFAALLAWFSLGRIWAWAVGGQAQLSLTHDPVPHGQKVNLKFTLAHAVKQREWSVKVSLLGPQEEGSGFGSKWSETFAAQPTGSHEVSTTIFIPRHVTPTKASVDGELHVATLMLKSGRRDWMFRLETQSEPSL